MDVHRRPSRVPDEKGIECGDPEKLRASLTTIGYYRLSAYWFPYKTIDKSGNTVFREGTSFEHIMRTYELDNSLRLLIFEAVGKIEVFLPSRLAYFAAGESGVFGYPESVRDRLKREYSAAKRGEQYIKHFASKYGDVHDLPPYWMMVECATMGTIEILFADVSPRIRVEVASELGVRVPIFKNWLSVFRVSRNACCHHARVWNRTWGVRPMIPKPWDSFGAPNDRTFAVLSVLYYVLGIIDEAEPWRLKLEELLETYDDIPAEKLGFPRGWRDADPWALAKRG